MSFLKSTVIAFSMFSRIPMPRVEWDAKNMRLIMAAFPLVGVVIGAVQFLWLSSEMLRWSSDIIHLAGIVLIPVLITGGIHLDGFCDTVDAVSSRQSRERKLEILNDPHIGAFAVIGLVCYFLAYFSLSSELLNLYGYSGLIARDYFLTYSLTFVLSRTLSGLAVVYFPCAKDSGLGKTFADASARKSCGLVLIITLVVCCALMIDSGGASGVCAIICAMLVFLYYRRTALREFGGITGDTAGWFLQICELACMTGILIPVLLPNMF